MDLVAELVALQWKYTSIIYVIYLAYNKEIVTQNNTNTDAHNFVIVAAHTHLWRWLAVAYSQSGHKVLGENAVGYHMLVISSLCLWIPVQRNVYTTQDQHALKKGILTQ